MHDLYIPHALTYLYSTTVTLPYLPATVENNKALARGIREKRKGKEKKSAMVDRGVESVSVVF